MAGYNGFSKSNNAIAAERNGRHPLVAAAKLMAKEYGVTQKQAKAWLESTGTSEWHHTSSYYNVTPYYNTTLDDEAIASLKASQTTPKVVGDSSVKTGTLEYTEWSGTRKHPKTTTHTYIGEYVEKGDWFLFAGKRKKYTNCKVIG